MNLKENKNNYQLNKFSLEDAEEDGVLKWVEVLFQEDGTIKDSLAELGTRIVSFSPILKWGNISFNKLALEILSIGKKHWDVLLKSNLPLILAKNQNLSSIYCKLSLWY